MWIPSKTCLTCVPHCSKKDSMLLGDCKGVDLRRWVLIMWVKKRGAHAWNEAAVRRLQPEKMWTSFTAEVFFYMHAVRWGCSTQTAA